MGKLRVQQFALNIQPPLGPRPLLLAVQILGPDGEPEEDSERNLQAVLWLFIGKTHRNGRKWP